MRTPLMTRIILAAAALAPLAAPAVDWTARLGADYTRTTTWSDGQETLSSPRLDLDLDLDARGFLYQPQVFDWALAGRYQRTAVTVGGADTVRDNLDFRGSAGIFRKPGSPLRLELTADRSVSDYSVSGPGGESKLVQMTFGGTAQLIPKDRPSLTLGYTWSGMESSGEVFSGATRTIQSITASTSMGPGPFTVTAGYAANLSEGTYASDNFAVHRANIDGRARIDAKTSAQISDAYYLRVPDVAGVVNPRQELNYFSGMFAWDGEGLDSRHVAYRYTHALQTGGTALDTERANQRIEFVDQSTWGTEWRLRSRASVAMGQDRVGGTELRSTAETVGTALYWNRRTPEGGLSIHGGPSASFFQPEDDSDRFGFGLAAGAAWNRRLAPFTVRAQYDANYSSDLDAVAGWSLSQTATGSADRAVGMGHFTADVRATSHAGDHPLLGPSANRQLELGSRYAWRTYAGHARFILASNMHGTIDESLGSDGLFIPPGYDSHSRTLAIGGSATFLRYYNLSANARYTSNVLPDRPDRDETEVRGRFEWAYGALRFALEDRYIRSQTNSGTFSRNLVMVSVFRVFGSRY
jgi:hypothetical protein